MSSKDSQWMRVALDEARAAYERGEVPVGAVLISASGDERARAGNRIEELSDPTAHAEIMAIRDAAKAAGSPRLLDATLYVTLEPCAMCAQAISLARIKRLVFAAYDPKGGGVEHGARVFSHKTCHHIPDIVGGLMETEASDMLRDFFKARR